MSELNAFMPPGYSFEASLNLEHKDMIYLPLIEFQIPIHSGVEGVIAAMESCMSSKIPKEAISFKIEYTEEEKESLVWKEVKTLPEPLARVHVKTIDGLYTFAYHSAGIWYESPLYAQSKVVKIDVTHYRNIF